MGNYMVVTRFEYDNTVVWFDDISAAGEHYNWQKDYYKDEPEVKVWITSLIM